MTRKLAAMFGAAGMVLLAAFYFGYWGPSTHQLDLANSRLDEARQAGVQVALERTQLFKARDGLPAMEALAAKLQDAAPSINDIPDLIDQLGSVATQTGVTITSEAWSQSSAATAAGGASSSASGAPVAGGLSSLPLSIGVSGTQPALLAFVHGLTTIPRLVKVNSLTLASPVSGATSQATGTPAAAATTTMVATAFVAPTKLPLAPKTH